ncbi:hypothetical protein [Saccharomonospora iraqiensis]|uniref:hypothetical protein n=1 Tax=Saccharomonospora iraqiensis TaxID=52698 RepID=UPI0004799AFD|nr:hypothetical protein [Saccharomonospora iraqiensis]
MWADETGGGTDTGATGMPDDMLVTVEGEQYSAETNLDLDGDGVADTAVVDRADGSTQAFVDHDGDGAADEYVRWDARDRVTAHADFDEATGEWVAVPDGQHPDGDPDPETRTSHGGTIVADLPGGDVEVGPATTDTDHDGVNDTAVVTDAEGNTVTYTDVDGDGSADVAVVIDDTGSARTYEHTGDGEWTGVDPGAEHDGVRAETPGEQAGWDGSGWDTPGTRHVEGVAWIDAATGQWISPN